MLEWIDSHGLLVSFGVAALSWTFSTIVGSMPSAAELKQVRPRTDPLFLLIYSKVLPHIQVLAGNAARLTDSLRIGSYLKRNGESKP